MNYPNIDNSKLISLDIETYDPKLGKKDGDMGPGVYRRDGYILGVSLAVEGFAEYYNIGHYDVTEEERNRNIEYIKHIADLPIPKIFANGMYDCNWLMYYTFWDRNHKSTF